LLGDTGEHYAQSQFSFAGKYAAKMPDNWKGYDLAVETGTGLNTCERQNAQCRGIQWL